MDTSGRDRGTARAPVSGKGRATDAGRTATNRPGEELAILAEIGRLISASLDIDEVYEGFAAEVRKLLPFDRLSVNLFDEREGTYSVAYVSGADVSAKKRGDRLKFEGSLTESVRQARAGMIVDLPDAHSVTERFPWLMDSFHKGLRAMLTVPLTSRGSMIGTLSLRSLRRNAYTQEDLHLAERIGLQIAGAIANARMFTDLRKAEQSLLESEASYRSIFNQAAVGVAKIEIPSCRFLMVNRRLCDIIGMTDEALKGTTLREIVHPEDKRVLPGGMKQFLMGRIGEFNTEKRFVRGDGSVIWTCVSLSRSSGPGKAGHCTAIIEDITERRRAQADSERRTRQLAALHAAGGRLMTQLHLGEVLNSIAGYALQVLGGTDCNLYLYKAEQDLLERFVRTGGRRQSNGMKPLAEPKRGKGVVGRVWEGMKPLLVKDYHIWPDRVRENDFMPPRNLMGAPVLWGDELLGVLVAAAVQPHCYTPDDLEVLQMFATQAAVAIHNAQLYEQLEKQIAERRKAEEALQETLDQLEIRVQERTLELEEVNTALRVLLKRGEDDQRRMEESVQGNINELVVPFLNKIKRAQTAEESRTYVNILETNLTNIASPFISHLSSAYKSLTPKEIQIAELIKQGKTSKEIAELIHVSPGTVITHRNNIRKKLNLQATAANLRSHLLFLSQ